VSLKPRSFPSGKPVLVSWCDSSSHQPPFNALLPDALERNPKLDSVGGKATCFLEVFSLLFLSMGWRMV
jgi:hypothetical protein